MGLFDLDSPLMNVLNKIADLMWLNILTLICCIPVFTAGASLTAMHYIALKIVRNEEGYITKGFFKSFKENFRQGTIIWLILLLVIAVFVGDFYIIAQSGIEFHVILKILVMAMAVLVLCTATFVFPVLAKFGNTIRRTIQNAFIMSILQFPKTVLMIMLGIAPVIIALLSVKTWPIVLLFGLSVPAWISAMLYNKFFQKYENIILETASERESAVEEEDDVQLAH